MRNGIRGLLAVLCTAAIGVCFVLAGPLDPPAGPVASSGKTLTEIEPRVAVNGVNTPGNASAVHVISLPGSYYMTTNLAVPPGRAYGIEITASDVTLDLRGFAITGQGVATNCIRAAVNVERIRISNGTVAGSSSHGISVVGPLTEVMGITATSCGGNGLDLGDGVRVSGGIARSNGAHGIRVGSNSRVSECGAVSNSVNGIEALPGSRIENCVVSNCAVGVLVGSGCVVDGCRVTTPAANTSIGFSGTSIATGVSLNNCSVTGGGGRGFWFQGGRMTLTNCSASGLITNLSAFEIGRDALLVDCRSENNGSTGFTLLDRCLVRACISTLNGGDGFSSVFSQSVVLEGCAAASNAGSGFNLGDGAAVRGCSAANNTGRGVAVSNGGLVEGCLTRNNQSHGIEVNFSCTVRNNNCNGDGANAASGIHAMGQANRLEGNNISYANVGVLIDSGGNMVTRTTCKGNAQNYFIAAGNAVAPIVSAATNGAVISGSTYGGSLGTADPNANFSY